MVILEPEGCLPVQAQNNTEKTVVKKRSDIDLIQLTIHFQNLALHL